MRDTETEPLTVNLYKVNLFFNIHLLINDLVAYRSIEEIDFSLVRYVVDKIKCRSPPTPRDQTTPTLRRLCTLALASAEKTHTPSS